MSRVCLYCGHRQNKAQGRNQHVYKFPEQGEVAKKWLEGAGFEQDAAEAADELGEGGSAGPHPRDGAYWDRPWRQFGLCAAHFTADSFERDIRAEIMGEVGRRPKLKAEAVPTVFTQPRSPLSRKDRVDRKFALARLRHLRAREPAPSPLVKQGKLEDETGINNMDKDMRKHDEQSRVLHAVNLAKQKNVPETNSIEKGRVIGEATILSTETGPTFMNVPVDIANINLSPVPPVAVNMVNVSSVSPVSVQKLCASENLDSSGFPDDKTDENSAKTAAIAPVTTSMVVTETETGTSFTMNSPGEILQSTMYNLWKQGLLTDVIVMTRNKPLCMHKVVWASHSRKFHGDLRAMQKVDSGSKLMVSVNADHETVQEVLDFMYTGRLVLNKWNMAAIHSVACTLNVDLVLKFCDIFSSGQLACVAKSKSTMQRTTCNVDSPQCESNCQNISTSSKDFNYPRSEAFQVQSHNTGPSYQGDPHDNESSVGFPHDVTHTKIKEENGTEMTVDEHAGPNSSEQPPLSCNSDSLHIENTFSLSVSQETDTNSDKCKLPANLPESNKHSTQESTLLPGEPKKKKRRKTTPRRIDQHIVIAPDSDYDDDCGSGANYFNESNDLNMWVKSEPESSDGESNINSRSKDSKSDNPALMQSDQLPSEISVKDSPNTSTCQTVNSQSISVIKLDQGSQSSRYAYVVESPDKSMIPIHVLAQSGQNETGRISVPVSSAARTEDRNDMEKLFQGRTVGKRHSINLPASRESLVLAKPKSTLTQDDSKCRVYSQDDTERPACLLCGITFDRTVMGLKFLTIHYRSAHRKVVQVECTLCEKIYIDSTRAARHVEEYHKVDKDDIACKLRITKTTRESYWPSYVV